MLSIIAALRYRLNLMRFFGSLLLVLTVFPYLQIVPSSNYTQPFALMLGAVLFCVIRPSVFFGLERTDQIGLAGLAGLGVLFFALTCFPYTEVQEYKYLVSYITPLMLTLPLLHFLNQQPNLAIWILRATIWIWFCVAFIQKFINPTFLGFLIGQWSDGSLDIIESGRGVLGLAPEPTHHAFHMLLLAGALSILEPGKRSSFLIMLALVDVIFLAASSSALLVMVIAGLVWSIYYRQRWYVVAAFISFVVWGSGFDYDFNSDYRIFHLISSVLEEPSAILIIDYSVNARLGGMIAVLGETLSNSLIPFGMSLRTWDVVRSELLLGLPWLIDLSSVGPPSGIGMILLQTGLFGGLHIILIFRRILLSDVGHMGRWLLIGSPLIFLGQYYFAAPTFSLLYASALYRLNRALPK